MFYDYFTKACELANKQPTPLVKSIGLSEGNIARWRDGGCPSASVLIKLSQELNVTIDYLLMGKKELPASAKENEQLNELFNMLSTLNSEQLTAVVEMLKAFINKRK